MSKNITIQEGGIAKQLTVDKLKTNLVNSGTCLWVPEDEVQLTTKTITENGTYSASSDGYYGYSQVIVSVANVGTATGTDGDGDEAVAHTDPGTGELVTDKVPSNIRVITPPTNPYGIYQNGQAIVTDGMVVKAYLQTGGEYGTVPNGEITLNPTTAVYDESTDYSGSATIDQSKLLYPEILNLPLVLSSYIECGERGVDYRIYTFENIGADYMFVFDDTSHSQWRVWAFSETGNGVIAWKEYRRIGDTDSYILNNSGNVNTEATAYTNAGHRTVYYGFTQCAWAYKPQSAYNSINAANPWADDIATVLYEGDVISGQGSHQQITVSWPRPLDYHELETSFEILVAPPIYGGGES